MKLTQKDIDFCAAYNADKYPHPSLTADTVLFRIEDQPGNRDKRFPERKLEVLLVRRGRPPYEGGWALPGGFCHMDEDTSVCAARELEEECGIEGHQLGQLAFFAKPDRDPRTRVVSAAYLALAAYGENTEPHAADDASEAAWFTVECATHPLTPDKYETVLSLTKEGCCIKGSLVHARGNALTDWHTSVQQDADLLAFDHLKVIAMGVEALRDRIYTTTAAFLCVPEVFRIADLQSVYEAVMGQELLRTTFFEHVKPRLTRLQQPADTPIADQLYRYNSNYVLPDGSSAIRIMND